MKNIVLFFSFFLNLLFIIIILFLGFKLLDGCAEIPNGRIGVLNKEITVGVFNTDKKLFTLPKGLVVREASATGAGWFEPYRFRLVVTSSNEDLVNYLDNKKQDLVNKSEYYSADNPNSSK